MPQPIPDSTITLTGDELACAITLFAVTRYDLDSIKFPDEATEADFHTAFDGVELKLNAAALAIIEANAEAATAEPEGGPPPLSDEARERAARNRKRNRVRQGKSKR